MISMGLIDSWRPEPGSLTTWTASPCSVREAMRAPAHPTPPSHQQEVYLGEIRRHPSTEFDLPWRNISTVTLPGRLDRTAAEHAVTAFLHRHDTFSSWFSVDEANRVQRHVVDPAAVDVDPVGHGWFDTPEQVHTHLEKTMPGPFDWNCFGFGVIEHEHSFTVYSAMDHIHADGFSMSIAALDIAMLYGRETGRYHGELLQPASYLSFCERERGYTAGLTPTSPGVMRWAELIRGNGGRLPSFPLDLGVPDSGYSRPTSRTIRLFGEDDATRFEKVCRENGAEFTGGIFAAAALAEHELIGADYYFGLTPISARASQAEVASVGWYATLIPVAFPLGRKPTFPRLVTRAQRSYDLGLPLTAVSPHRVVQLICDEPGLELSPDAAAVPPTISYGDFRRLTRSVSSDTDDTDVGMFTAGAALQEADMWINRMPTETWLTVAYPHTDAAGTAMERYLKALCAVFREIADRA